MVIIMYNDEQFEFKKSGYSKTKSSRSRKTLKSNNSMKNGAILMYHSLLDRGKKALSKYGIDHRVMPILRNFFVKVCDGA